MHGCIKSTEQFPIQKCEFFCKFKNIEKLRGSQVSWAAQVILQIDAEIVKKGNFWMETT